MAVTGYFVNDTASVVGLTDTKATLDTDAGQAANAAVIFTAVPPGVRGNSIKVLIAQPSDENVVKPLTIAVSRSGDFDLITITLAVASNGSTVTTTGTLLVAAVNAHEDASKLVVASMKAANDGSGLMAAQAVAALSGGAKDDILAGEIRKVTAMADADAILLINGGASFIPSASYDRRRAIARTIKYAAVSDGAQS